MERILEIIVNDEVKEKYNIKYLSEEIKNRYKELIRVNVISINDDNKKAKEQNYFILPLINITWKHNCKIVGFGNSINDLMSKLEEIIEKE